MRPSFPRSPLIATLTLTFFVAIANPTLAAPAPEPTPTPTPTTAPEPAPTPDLHHTAPTPSRSAHDRIHRFEVSITSEMLAFFSRSPGATTKNDYAFTPQIRVGFGLTEHFVLSLGWRNFVAMSRGDRGYDLTTAGDGLLVTARYELPLASVLALAAELDLEASHLSYDLTVGGRSGSTSTWGFGALPRLVFITRGDLDAISLDFRVFAGLALRTIHHPDDLRLDSAAANVTPLDLGRLDLNGFTAGATLAIGF